MRPVICLGDNCIDTYVAPFQRRFAGGSAVNVAVNLQRLGVEADYLGLVGDDAEGRALLDRLRAAGVGVERVQAHSGQTAFVRIELAPQGEPHYIHADLPPRLPIQLSAAELDFIAGHQLVHTTWLGRTEAYLPEFKRFQGLAVSMDYGPFFTQELLEQTLPSVDTAFFSMKAGKDIPAVVPKARELAEKIAASGPSLVVILLGAQGALAYVEGEIIHQPALAGAVVDTLGAGDAFIARVLAGRVRGEKLEPALEAAAQAAAKVCEFYGAWEGAEILVTNDT